MLRNLSFERVIIYANTTLSVDELKKCMTEQGYSVNTFHSDMDAMRSLQALRVFRIGRTRILITTGKLVNEFALNPVSLVVNYNFPSDSGKYIIRAGVSGLYANNHVVLSLATEPEEILLRK